MSLFDVIQNKAWALLPAKLDEINAFVEARLADPKASFEVVAGKSGNKADDGYEIRDGVAIIPVYGVIDKRMNMFQDISGGTSTELLKRDIQAALADRMVDAIVLDIDSPGGSVDGTKEVADFIFENRGKKPVIAYGNGMMASAAYWIGSAAGKIIANETALVGSIGVALTHYDRSAADEKAGVKRTTIYSGKYKRIASDEKPLTDEGREYLQSMTDTYYSIFVEGVARNRAASVESVLANMADGKGFIGKQAKKAGLVDKIGTMATAVKLAKTQGGKLMDLKALQEKYPELYAEAVALGNSTVDVAKITADATEAGTTAERTRVIEILGAGGDPAVAIKAIEDGLATEATFKLFFLAEKGSREQALADMRASLTDSAGHAAIGKENSGDSGDTFMMEVDAYQTEKKCSRTEALRAVVAKNPDLHEKYLQSLQEKGE